MTTQLTLEGVGPTVIDIPLTQPDFHIDLTIQQRVELDAATVADYAALYREGHDLGRITVFADEAAGCYWLSDGFHRRAAAQQAGLTTLPAVVYPGGRREALLYATSCNLHGKARSNADKKKSVLTLLQDAEWGLWSDNHIAKHTGVSHTFVSRLRDSLATVISEYGETETSQPATRRYINKHGQQVTMQVDAIGHRKSQATCADCGRPLTDAGSIRRGTGPVCACKTTSAASGSASPGPLLQDASDSEQAALEHDQGQQADKEKARKAAEDRAERQTRACAEAVQYLGELVTDYGFEVVETQILAVFLAAHGRPAPASHGSQAVDPGAIPEEVRQAPPTTPGQAPQTGLAARVRAALPTYGLQGTTAGALAKVLGVSNDKTWRNLERLVKQGKARKAGTTYIFLAEKEHA
jgi:hypothetical protein